MTASLFLRSALSGILFGLVYSLALSWVRFKIVVDYFDNINVILWLMFLNVFLIGALILFGLKPLYNLFGLLKSDNIVKKNQTFWQKQTQYQFLNPNSRWVGTVLATITIIVYWFILLPNLV